MYGASEVQTGSGKRDIPARGPQLAQDAAGDDAVVEERRDHEREQGRLRPQHAPLVGPRGQHRPLVEPLLAGLAKGGPGAVVAEAFPFDRAADAHRFIEERRNIGKVVLVP